MPTPVEIEIFNISRTTVDRNEVERWLQRLGCEEFVIPEEEAISDPALLIALAGKRCYLSFEKGLNPNITQIREDYVKYFDNILASGHGSVCEHSVYSFAIEGVSRVFCYTPETEVLTRSGWKPVCDVRAGEFVLTKDPETGDARWSVNHETHVFEYAGPVHYWESSEERSPNITPDHTLWAADMHRRRTRGMSAEAAADAFSEKIPYRDMAGKLFTVDHRIGGIQDDVCPDFITLGDYSYPAPLLAEWLGLVATDGTLSNAGGRNRVRIYQIKDATRIRVLMDLLFPNRWRHNPGSEPSFDISDPHVYRWAMTHLGPTKDQRDLSILFGWGVELVSAFIRGAELGDGGSNTTDHQYLYCSLPAVAAQFQVLYAKLGRASRVTLREPSAPHVLASGQLIVATRQATALSVNKKGVSQCQPYMQRVLHHIGIVACPRTDDGIVYVRHPQGRAMWCGNTAEMNRHRAGWAVSEGSLRFIRFGDNVPYWEPTSITGSDIVDGGLVNAGIGYIDAIDTRPSRDGMPDDEYAAVTATWARQVLRDAAKHNGFSNELCTNAYEVKKQLSRAVFREAFAGQESWYRVLEIIWADELAPASPFKDKKHITSMMRRIIGLGVSTGGVWTGNIRALRHVFAMRSSPAAEEEMLHVFSRLVKVMMEKEPLLFGDFYQDDNGFWRPKYPKV